MNAQALMNDAMSYIEDHLKADIIQEEVAHVAGCSDYHFRRMFSFLTGMPLGEYIRCRRLAAAGIEIRESRKRITDIAFEYGYESADSFGKAFKAMHGVSPSMAREKNIPLKTFSPLVFTLSVKGGSEMMYRIIEKESFVVIGFKKRITLQYEGVNPEMEQLIKRLTPEIIQELKGMNDVEPKGILNVSTNFADRTGEGTELDQYVGVATTSTVSDRYDILPVEASTWAVFTCIGDYPKKLQDTWAQIYGEWFPTSGYELTGGPEILWNEGPDTTKQDYKSEIWIPVRKLNSAC